MKEKRLISELVNKNIKYSFWIDPIQQYNAIDNLIYTRRDAPLLHFYGVNKRTGDVHYINDRYLVLLTIDDYSTLYLSEDGVLQQFFENSKPYLDNIKDKTVYNMELHESLYVNKSKVYVLRVPGGWIYRSVRNGSDVFVPYCSKQ
jgi:hypothetical protein